MAPEEIGGVWGVHFVFRWALFVLFWLAGTSVILATVGSPDLQLALVKYITEFSVDCTSAYLFSGLLVVLDTGLTAVVEHFPLIQPMTSSGPFRLHTLTTGRSSHIGQNR
jgi:hypothetical protein